MGGPYLRCIWFDELCSRCSEDFSYFLLMDYVLCSGQCHNRLRIPYEQFQVSSTIRGVLLMPVWLRPCLRVGGILSAAGRGRTIDAKVWKLIDKHHNLADHMHSFIGLPKLSQSVDADACNP